MFLLTYPLFQSVHEATFSYTSALQECPSVQSGQWKYELLGIPYKETLRREQDNMTELEKHCVTNTHKKNLIVSVLET